MDSTIAAGFDRPRDLFLLAKLHGAIIGCGALKELSTDDALVTRFFVASSHRGSGLATRLFDTLFERAHTLGYTTIVLDVNRESARAIRFYEKQGMEEFIPAPHPRWLESAPEELSTPDIFGRGWARRANSGFHAVQRILTTRKSAIAHGQRRRAWSGEKECEVVLRSYVGAPVKRKEDPRLITGSSIYVDDLTLPGMVHLAIVRSPYAHARIVGIDTPRRVTMPGVVAVVTATGPRSACWPTSTRSRPTRDPASGQSSRSRTSKNESTIPVPVVEPLARRKVRYIGEPVAAVVARRARRRRRTPPRRSRSSTSRCRPSSIPTRRGSRAPPAL